MRFALWANPGDTWSATLAAALHAEATGWDAVYVSDHFMPADVASIDNPVHECWTVLAALAAATRRVRLGSLVSCTTYRHPAVLANMAASIDRISGGRLVLGVGAGYQDNEHQAYGIDLGTVAQRFERLEETCQVLLGLLREHRTTFAGRHYSLFDAPLEPKPLQRPMPLLIGGGGETTTLRLVARYADEWNMWGLPEDCHEMGKILTRRCDEVGRDVNTIVRSAQALLIRRQDIPALRRANERIPTIPADHPAQIVEAMAAYRDAGIEEFVVPTFLMPDPSERADFVDRFQQAVIQQAV